MEDVLAVYERPYNPKRPVVCADEANKTLLDTPRGTLPIETGQAPRQDYEYERNGTANIFMAVEPLIGKRRTLVTDRRANQDFAELLRCLSDEEYPDITSTHIRPRVCANDLSLPKPDDWHNVLNGITHPSLALG